MTNTYSRTGAETQFKIGTSDLLVRGADRLWQCQDNPFVRGIKHLRDARQAYADRRAKIIAEKGGAK